MERIAIVGTGVAGLSCAWNLRGGAKITLFEQDARPGGHTNTVVVDEHGEPVPIDTGFIVFNCVTYPHLCRLFEEMGVATQPSEMSFSVQHLPDGLEYNGMGLRKVFAQKRNLLRPRFHRLLAGIQRFFKVARASLDDASVSDLSVRQFAERHGFDRDVLEYYLVPMSAAVWSSRPDEILDFPAAMLIRFFYNHGFLGVDTHHQWFTVSRGAKNYVRKILEPIADIRLGDAVVAVDERADRAVVRTAGGMQSDFDRVIVATHADQALRLLAAPTEDQRRLLSPFAYQRNPATLHTDESWMPRRRVAWASWNYRIEAMPEGGPHATTHYWMNALQNVSTRRDYFVSLHCQGRIAPEHVLYETVYEHPIFTLEALRAQRELPRLNRRSPGQRLFFCGSYFRYGFHEDACASAVEACAALRER